MGSKKSGFYRGQLAIVSLAEVAAVEVGVNQNNWVSVVMISGARVTLVKCESRAAAYAVLGRLEDALIEALD